MAQTARIAALKFDVSRVATLAGWALLAVAATVLAGWVFTRIYRYAVRTGLLARYSAESAT